MPISPTLSRGRPNRSTPDVPGFVDAMSTIADRAHRFARRADNARLERQSSAEKASPTLPRRPGRRFSSTSSPHGRPARSSHRPWRLGRRFFEAALERACDSLRQGAEGPRPEGSAARVDPASRYRFADRRWRGRGGWVRVTPRFVPHSTPSISPAPALGGANPDVPMHPTSPKSLRSISRNRFTDSPIISTYYERGAAARSVFAHWRHMERGAGEHGRGGFRIAFADKPHVTRIGIFDLARPIVRVKSGSVRIGAGTTLGSTRSARPTDLSAEGRQPRSLLRFIRHRGRTG